MKRQIVVDTETTGYSPVKGRHRIIDIALVEIVNGELTGKSFQSYINPEGRKSTHTATKLHKIKDSFLLDKPLFKEQLSRIINFIDNCELIFYNKSFDLEFLDNEASIANSNIIFSSDFKTTCAFDIVMNTLSRKRKVSLDDACRIYGVDNSARKNHGALIDAELTAKLYLELTSRSKLLNRVPQKATRSKPEKFPLPRAYEGYQINYCKNPKCSNYGIPPKFPNPMKIGKSTKTLGDYKISLAPSNKTERKQMLHCKICNSASLIFSNKSIIQEVKRLQSIYQLKVPCCPNTGQLPNKRTGTPDGRRYKKIVKKIRGKEIELVKLKPTCENMGRNILEYPDNYWLDSKNTKKLTNVKGLPKIIFPDADGKYHDLKEAVSQTFKCKECHTKFSSPINPQKGQSKQQINYQLFSMLVNKGIINRISEMLRINHALIYSRIKFFYVQCIQFEQFQLKTNLHKLKNRHLNLSLDRQMFYANWSSKKDARRTRLINTSTVDNNTRYVFGSTMNFDFTSDYTTLLKESKRIGEYEKEPHKRRYQQYVLPDDNIHYDEDNKTPKRHLLVQQSYSVISHLEMLKPVLENVGSIYLYGDNDHILDTAIAKVFKNLIKSEKLQACTVRTSKLNEGESEYEKGFEWIPQDAPVIDGNYLDLKLLTDCNEDFLDQASLHGVDNYFNILRRRLSMVERPFKASENKNTEHNIERDKSAKESKFEKWNLYGSYNPKYVSMLIEIVRIFNNFILTDEKTIKNLHKCKRTPKTPAQKIGLVDNGFDIHDILEFSVANIALDCKSKKTKST
ncbi:MAG: DNA polymerase III epsilon subunit [Psychroserpens sp.]|jgi:DNA polymerase III epsilon subunit